jgi:hypothetical protein
VHDDSPTVVVQQRDGLEHVKCKGQLLAGQQRVPRIQSVGVVELDSVLAPGVRGEGHVLEAAVGHDLVELRQAAVPVNVHEEPVRPHALRNQRVLPHALVVLGVELGRDAKVLEDQHFGHARRPRRVQYEHVLVGALSACEKCNNKKMRVRRKWNKKITLQVLLLLGDKRTPRVGNLCVARRSGRRARERRCS